MSQPLFTATVSAVGGREGKVISSDRVLELDVAMPGTPRAKKLEKATNPERLFAAGYAACFDSALRLVARTERVKVETEVTANVSLLKDEADQGYKLGVTPQRRRSQCIRIGGACEKSARRLPVFKSNLRKY